MVPHLGLFVTTGLGDGTGTIVVGFEFGLGVGFGLDGVVVDGTTLGMTVTLETVVLFVVNGEVVGIELWILVEVGEGGGRGVVGITATAA